LFFFVFLIQSLIDLFIIREHHEIIGILFKKETFLLQKYSFNVYRINNKENELDEDNRQRKHSTNRTIDTFKFREHGQKWSKV